MHENMGNALLFTFLLFHIQVVYSNDWFSKIVEHRDTKSVYSVTHDVSLPACLLMCSTERRSNQWSCIAVNYFPAKRLCEFCKPSCNQTATVSGASPGWVHWTTPAFATCGDWKKAGCDDDGEYFLDTWSQEEGLTRFRVECKM